MDFTAAAVSDPVDKVTHRFVVVGEGRLPLNEPPPTRTFPFATS